MNSDGGGGGSIESGPGTTERGRPIDATDAATNSDEGYVHRPDSETASPADAGASDGSAAATTGVRGWALVGVVVTCFLVIPGIIYLRPAAPGRLGLPFFAAMLALPMLPALILGLTAVWSMRGPREERDGT